MIRALLSLRLGALSSMPSSGGPDTATVLAALALLCSGANLVVGLMIKAAIESMKTWTLKELQTHVKEYHL